MGANTRLFVFPGAYEKAKVELARASAALHVKEPWNRELRKNASGSGTGVYFRLWIVRSCAYTQRFVLTEQELLQLRFFLQSVLYVVVVLLI